MAKFLPYVGIAIFCGFMVTGQFLFKLASGHAKEAKTVGGMIEAIAYSPWFWTAGVMYGVASLLWVVILTRVPLSIAYPASALTIALVPLVGWLFFDEVLNLRFFLGMGAMLIGVWLIASK